MRRTQGRGGHIGCVIVGCVLKLSVQSTVVVVGPGGWPKQSADAGTNVGVTGA